jgi:hypothetical protein
LTRSFSLKTPRVGFVSLGCPKALIDSEHTGPHAPDEVMAAVHTHLPRPHDPFVDLVPPQGVKLRPYC